MSADNAALPVSPRDPGHSRSTRRLRREGLVPGVIYGGDGEPQHVQVDGRTLRNTLARAGAVIEVSVGGATSTPVIVKDLQRHPVRGEAMHFDLLRVRMDVAIQTPVVVELLGAEEAPGVKDGGVLSQEHREVMVESLPGDIPGSLKYDVSAMEINSTAHISDLVAPAGVTIVDDPEIVIATITPPTLEPVEEELEVETGVVGEEGEVVEGAEGEPAAAEGAADAAGDSSPDES